MSPGNLAEAKVKAADFSVLPTQVPSAAGCVTFVIAKEQTNSQDGVVWAGPSRNRTAAYVQTLLRFKCKKNRNSLNSDSKQKCRTSLFGL